MKATLRVHRINKGLSIEEAAMKLGLKVDELRKMELYVKYPSTQMLIKIMKLYAIDYIDDILLCNKKQAITKLKEKASIQNACEKNF